jgi:uncharacterized protein YegP (UPF0339 family)
MRYEIKKIKRLYWVWDIYNNEKVIGYKTEAEAQGAINRWTLEKAESVTNRRMGFYLIQGGKLDIDFETSIGVESIRIVCDNKIC